MKKLFTLLIILLLWAGSSWAITVQIGSGTTTTSYFPLYTCYNYNYSQQIYLQSEISEGGGGAGPITKIRFYYSSGGTTFANWTNWTVYIGNTTKTNFTSTSDWVPVGSMTQVFSGNIPTPVAGTWLELTLSPSFNYTGGNLVVAVDENSAGYSCTAAWRSFASGSNRGILYYSDDTNPNPASPPTANYGPNASISQIQFDMAAATGPLNPTAFTATAVSSTQINLSWALNASGNPVMLVWNSTNTFGTPVNGTSYGVGATIPGGGTVLQNNTNTSYNHTPLTSNTPYYYKAYSVDVTVTYSSGATSNATTFCDVFSQINEDFELAAFPPDCWSLVSGSGNWARTTLASGYGSGSASALANFYNISGSTPFDLVSPQFNTTNAVVSFDHAYATFETENDQLLILYSTNGGSSYNLLITLDGGVSGPLNTGGAMTGEFVPSASQWATKSYSLPAGTNKVKFQAISAYGNDLYLDNIFIGQPPSVDLRFNQFYQSSGLPIPLNAGPGSKYVVKNKMAPGNRMDFFTTLQSDANGVPASEVINTILVPDQNRSITSIMLADIQVTAEIENIGLDPASYVLDWEVGGVAQTSYTGPTVAPGDTHIANLLYPSPPARGTFFATGEITVVDDANPGNNNNAFRLRVYPDVYGRTIYDRGDNDVDTYIGWNNATIAMKAGVRYTASDYIKPVGVDFICRTETVPSGTYTIEVRAAGATDQAPGAVLYSIPYTDPVFFSEGGDYMHFAFDENLVPTIAPSSDYWITIECPLGVLYPGAAQSSGFTPGRSFYYVASTDSWTPLVISIEYAWIMRSVHVQGEIPECPAPSLQTVDNITTVGADLGWTDEAGTYWDLYIVPAGDPAPTLISVPTINDTPDIPYTWPGGSPNSSYDWYVRRDCGQDNTDVSTWTGPNAFTTLCAGNTTYPFCESFDGQTFPPDCWITQKTAGTGTPGTWDGQTTGTNPTCSPHSGAGMARYNSYSLSSGTAGILASLPLDLPDDNYLAKFWMYRDDGYIGYSNELVNVYFNTQNNLTGATLLGTIHRSIDYSPVVASNGWYEYSFNFPVGSGGIGRYVIFEAVSQFGNNMFIDDVCFESQPTCPAPTGLAASNITPTTADLEWEVPVIEPESFFDISYGLDGYDPETGGTIVTGITAPPYTVENLDPETTYDWYVRKICGLGAPKLDHFWIAINESSGLESPSGGLSDPDPGEDLIWRQYLSPAGSFWYNIWFYNQPFDDTRMKIIRMGFWVQPLNPLIQGNISYVVNWSTPDWVPPDPPGYGYPMPPDEAHIARSPENVAPVPMVDPMHPTGYWMELYYIIPDYNPEWVSVDIWGTNVTILQSVIAPPDTSPLYYWWQQSQLPGGIIVHECVPKPRGYISPWSAASSFTTLVACPQPTALNATNVTAHSANLTWTQGFAETAWEYAYGLSPLPVPGGSGIATTSNTVNPVLGLSENSAYQYYVRAYCDPDYSDWSGPYAFNTPLSCPPPTVLSVSNITTTSADVSWTPGGSESSWNVQVGLPGFTPGTNTEILGINGTSANPWTATPLQPASFFDVFVEANCGLDQPKKENFWIQLYDDGEIGALSGGAPADDPGEDGKFYFYQDWGVPWHNVWWYNGPLDMTRMKIIRMGFWVQRINQQAEANITYVVNWSTSDWGGTGFPTPQPTDTAYIDRSPMSAPVQVFPTDPLQPFGQWVELYYVIPDFNPEWVSVDLWGQNVQIVYELTPPPMESPLYSWWIQDPQLGGILLHECLPKPVGNTSTWVGPVTFSTACNPGQPPICDSFFDIWPVCWTEQLTGLITSGHWSIVNSNFAGGVTNEARAYWSPGQGATQADNDRMVSPPFNTAGLSSIHLSFRQMLDDYESGYPDVWIKVQSSSDGVNWTDEWIYGGGGGGGGSIPAEVKTLEITNNLGGTTWIAWTLSGNTIDIDNWYVDDICISHTCIWNGMTPEWDNPYNWSCGTVPGPITNVIIPSAPSGGHFPVIMAPIEVEILSMDLQGGAVVTVQDGAILNILHHDHP